MLALLPRRRPFPLATILPLATLALAARPTDLVAQSVDVTRVTVSSSGEQANDYSPAGAISADGRYVVFRSDATNLVANDTNGVMDVFVHDRVTRTTTRVSVGTGGVQANGPSLVDEPVQLISRDGRYVVFESAATNLVPGDTNGVKDVFVHDRVLGQTQRVSLDSLGQQVASESVDPHISADGQSIAFATGASLVPGQPGGLYVRDRVTGQNTLISRSTGGVAGNSGSYGGFMSADGRHVAFISFADNLVAGDTNGQLDIFVHDRQTATTTRVNVSDEVPQTTGQTNHVRISGDGRFVSFSTDATTTLSLDDTNGAEDVWMRDRDTDRDGIFDEPGAVRTFRVSTSAAGVQGNGHSLTSSLSYDGRFVAFASDADNLLGPGQDANAMRDIFVADLDADADGIFDEAGDRRFWRVSVALDGSPVGGGQAYTHDISEDGRYVHFDSNAEDLVRDDTNGEMDSFVVDRLAWATTTSMAPTTAMQRPRISGNGGWSVFASADATLVAGDTNGQVDVFVRNRRLPLGAPGAVVRVSVAGDGGQAIGGASDQAAISDDGRFVVFRSTAVNLVPLDTNGAADVFLHDRDPDRDGVFDEADARQTYRVSVATGGGQAAAASGSPDVSPHGRYVAFVSAAANLVTGGNGLRQAFLHDRLTGATIRVSERDALPADADVETPVVGDNGTVAFATAASNLSDADANASLDVYASVVPAGGGRAVVLISHRLGAAAAGESGAPAISADGLVVAFQSTAALVTGDTNGVSDVFAAPVARLPQFGVGPVVRLSVTRTGGNANGSSGAASISADLGRGYVAGSGGDLYDWTYAVSFTSSASNLVFGDTNGVDDVFTIRVNGLSLLDDSDQPVLLLDPSPLTTRVSLDAAGGQFPTRSGISSISANGTRVEYERPLPGATSSAAVFDYDLGDDKSVGGTSGVRIGTPSVTGMVPRSGPPGSLVTITGTGLDNPEVTFALGAALEVESRSDRALVARTHPASTGTQILTAGGPVDFGKSTSGPLTFTFTASPACSYGPPPAEQGFAAAAGGRDVTIAASSGCDWAVAVPPDAAWITVSRTQGTGPQSIRVDVAANEESGSRRARIDVTGGSFDVVQDGTPCTFALQAPSATWSSDPQMGAVRITTRAGCAWTTSGHGVDWVRLRQTQGTGGLDLHYDVAAHEGTATRSHTFTIAGHAYTVHQSGGATRLLRLTRSGNGRVTSTPAGIDCATGSVCAAAFPAGTTVTLHAEAFAGATFDGWTGPCAGTGTCSVEMQGNRDVGAAFVAGPVRHQLTVSKAGAGTGTVVSAPAGIACGTTCQASFEAGVTVSLTAAAAGGSRFAGWEGACTAAGQVTLAVASTCVARFDREPSTYTVSVSVAGPGRVTSVPAGLDCTGTCAAQFPTRSTVTLIATPTPGRRFTWGGACSGTAACVRHVTDNIAVTADFPAGTGAPIAVTDVQPRSGLAAGGTVLRVHGAGFSQPGGVSVTLGGVPASAVDVVSDTLLVVLTGAVPGAPAVVAAPVASVVHTGDLVVNVAGATASLSAAYRAVALSGTEDADTDGDSLPDSYEAAYGLDVLVADSLADPDGDGASNLLELEQSTHPQGHYRRFLAEGATGPFFDTRINAANPGHVPATVLLRFQGAGPNVVQRIVVPGRERRYTYPRHLPNLGHNAFSTLVESNTEIVVDRSMFWPPSLYGSHAETSVAEPASTWYLAEGATGPVFDLFYLLQNPDLSRAADIRVQFLRPSGAPILRSYVVPPASRLTVYVDQIPELAHAEVSGVVESTNGVPIIVERAMYLTRNGQTFGGGHGSAGVTSPSTSWFLAEGATGDYFDTFVLIANPSTAAAELTATFMRPDGSTVVRDYTVAPQSRRTIQVDGVDPALAATSVATSIVSTNGVGVIVERAMYWPGPQVTAAFWHEAHNSPGATETGTLWALADGETGGPPVSTTTYYLIANTSPFAGSVKVSLLFENGEPPAERTFTVPANARLTVSVPTDFPLSAGRGYGALIESLGPAPAQIVVERAMYSNAEGVVWAAGTNALATRLR